jgi:hypothetical protein
MANGILVTYSGSPYALSSLFPDNGLASLAAVLRSEGHDCLILDYNTAETMSRVVDEDSRTDLRSLLPRLESGLDAESLVKLTEISRHLEDRSEQVTEDIAREVVSLCRRRSADFVGFKLWSGDGFQASVTIAERIRAALPRVRLFAGGPSVHYGGALVHAEAPVFDAVIDGDGEEAILELARHAEGKRPLQGIPNRVAVGETAPASCVSDLSTLPIPIYDRDVYPSVWNGGKIRLFCIDESRGCPMRCAFCINWRIEGAKWRTRDPGQVVAEIRGLREKTGSRAFRLAGTYSPPKLVRQICEGILREGLDVRFGLSLHAKGVSESLLSLLRRAGCFGVFYGAESGSDEIQRAAMNKPIGSDRLRRVLSASLASGLFTVASFIFPAPFETDRTEHETKALIREVFGHTPRCSVMACFPALLPGTAWWRERGRFGFALQVEEAAYVRTLLRYRVRSILPTALWPELPYRVNGCQQSELARRNTDFQRWLRSEDIVVNLPDHDALIATALGIDAAQFQNTLRSTFFTGDGPRLKCVVCDANESLAV